MQAVLNVGPDEVDQKLLNVIRELLSRDVEVTLKNSAFELEAFDSSISLEDVMEGFRKEGYSEEFLLDLRTGFETSEIYAR